ncbi:MAG TPA: hypothetical protein VGR01_15725 [Burkholderiales bacterium]|jgi:hypothetical protein|nr:hypothetical protein [Burkholderiales bacterium]
MTTLTHELPLSRNITRKLWPFHVGALADTLVGLDLVIFAGDIARLLVPEQATILGFATTSVMRFLGAFLILFAIDTVVLARSQGRLARFLSWIVAANWATVALAVVVIALWHAAFSVMGIAAVAVIAVAVGIFAALQQRAL